MVTTNVITIGTTRTAYTRRRSASAPLSDKGNDMKSWMIIALLSLYPTWVFAKDPNCSGIDQWPTNMAFVHQKNAGITDNSKIDFTKTKTIRIASEKIGKNLYRQVHHVIFTEKSEKIIEVITSNDASNDECSMSGVDVFVISKHLEK